MPLDAQIDRFKDPERVIHVFRAEVSDRQILRHRQVEIRRPCRHNQPIAITDER